MTTRVCDGIELYRRSPARWPAVILWDGFGTSEQRLPSVSYRNFPCIGTCERRVMR